MDFVYSVSVKKDKKKVFVGMSGGVDSSVAALLLKNDYDVVGVHLRCWNKDGCDVQEAEDARRVADKLEVPFYVFDMEREYKERVVNYMIDGYKRGITPNPDIMCNSEIKFGLFLEKALSMGADYVATGHYAKIKEEDGVYSIYSGSDKEKDQSYFLWKLTQDKLKNILFPLGDLTKAEIRKIAKDAGLHIADKKDSQGICFVGKVTLKEFLGEYLLKERGNAKTPSGKILGTHEGAHFYTIGQRHGLGIAKGEPYYVADKNVNTNTVVLAERDDPTVSKNEIEISDINLISDDNLQKDVLVRIRYRQPPQKAKINGTKIIFNEPQEFIAPGQSAVFYNKDGKMLGGGIIAS